MIRGKITGVRIISLVFSLETLLGISLGIGFMTSLRFWGSVGLSEILVGFVIFGLAKKYIRDVFLFHWNAISLAKLYLLFSVFIVLPIATFISSFFLELITSERDIVVFAGGLLMLYLLVEARKQGFDFVLLTAAMTVTFLLGVTFASYFLPDDVVNYADVRFTGGAKNPNQLVIYATALMLLSARFFKGEIALIVFVLVAMVGSLALSDAFDAVLVLICLSYMSFILLYTRRFPVIANVAAYLAVSLLALLWLYMDESSVLLKLDNLWDDADEGGVRIFIYENAFIAAIHSPIFGLGAGSFAGTQQPFQQMEAHNTFLDFSMSFGFPFAIYLYSIMVYFVFISLKVGRNFVAAVAIGFIIFSIFHFIGRHFVFWVVISVMLHDIGNFGKAKLHHLTRSTGSAVKHNF